MAATVNIGTLEGLLKWKADDAELQRSLSDVAKKADVSKSQLSSYNRELAGIDAAYKRVVASIDPAAAATAKYEKAQSALSAAYKAGLISITEYANHSEKLVDSLTKTEHHSESLIGSILKLTGMLGPVGAAGHEAAEGLESIAAKGEGITELVASFGPLLPVIVGLATALVAVGIAFEAFEFVKDAVEEGLKLQVVIDRLNDSLHTTGSYSGLSAHEIIELAGSFALLTGRTKEELVQAGLVLTHFRHLTEESYPKAMDASIAYARAMDITVAEAARKLGPILDGNTRSLRGLKEAGVDLTKGQLQTMNRMVEQGHIVEYQNYLFNILTEKVGKASDVHDTLTTQVGRAKVVYTEFKEGIASEVIPALEDAFSAIIESIGGWDKLKYVVVETAHEIGDVIRSWVYNQMIGFYEIRIGLNVVAIAFDNAVISIAGSVEKLTIAGSAIPGLTGDISSALGSVFHVAVNNASKDLYDDTKALNSNTLARAGLVTGLQTHRQALEGDEEVHKKLKPAQDDVASAQKKINDLMAEADKAIRAYTDSLSDHIKKLEDQIIAQAKLFVASQQGTLAYAQARQEMERANAIETAATQLAKEHRTEIEKLSDVQKKMQDAGQGAQAAIVGEKIKKANDDYARQRDLLIDLTGRNFDLKHATDEQNKSNAETDAYLAKIITLQSQLTDELDGTTFSSREMAIQLEITKRQTAALKDSEDDLGQSIAETVRREHERIDSMNDAIEVSRELTKLNNQASLQTAISRIDTSQSASLQQVEQQYLTIIAGIGKGSIEEGQKILDATRTMLESLGIYVGDLSQKIKDDLLLIADTKAADAIKLSLKTPTDIINGQITDIFRYMSEGLLTAAQGEQELAKIRGQEFETISGQWGSVLSYLSNQFGGLFQKLYGWFQQAEQLIAAMKAANSATGGDGSLGALFGAGKSGGASAGTLAGYALAGYAAYVAYLALFSNEHTQTGSASLGGGQSGDMSISAHARDAVTQLIKEVTDLAKQLNLGLTSLANNSVSITITSNKEIIVRTLLDGVGKVFTDMAAALDYAKVQALKFAEYSTTTAHLVVAALRASRATTSEELQSQLNLATTLATQNQSQAQSQVSAAFTLFNQQISESAALFASISVKYGGDLEAMQEAVESAVSKLVSTVAQVKNQFLGIDDSVSKFLDDLIGFQKGVDAAGDSARKAIQDQIDAAEQQITSLLTHVSGGGGLRDGGENGSPTGEIGGINSDSSALDAKTQEAIAAIQKTIDALVSQLGRIPVAMSDAELNMSIFGQLDKYVHGQAKYRDEEIKWAKAKVDIEFDLIKLKLIELNKWEEFAGMFGDAYNAALLAAGKTPGSGHGAGASGKQSVQSFIDDRRFQLSIAGMDAFHQQLANINREYAAQLVSAGKDKKLREQLLALQQQETAAAIAAHLADVTSRYTSLVSPADAYDTTIKPFEDMRKEIEAAGYSADKTAEMLAGLTKAEDDAVKKMQDGVRERYSQLVSPGDNFVQTTRQFEDMKKEIEGAGFGAFETASKLANLTRAEDAAIKKLSDSAFSSMLGDLSNIIADSDTNTKQHLLHNELLRVQEIVNFQMKMIELHAEYDILKAKGKLTDAEIALLDKAFGWIDKNANILPGGKDWIPSFEQAASNVASAASNLSTSSDALKSAAQSLIDYQTSLHTDSSLGLVDPRTALANSKLDYEADRAKALAGDVDAIAKLKDFAETYRKNLIAFSPSSELAASVLSGIDDTINQIKSMPAVKAALSLTPDAQAIITNLGYVASGVGVLKLATDAVNDNVDDMGNTLKFITPTAIADATKDKESAYQDAVLSSQKASAESLASVRDDMKKLADNVLAWRTEQRANTDDAHVQRETANDKLTTIAANTRHARPLAGSGG